MKLFPDAEGTFEFNDRADTEYDEDFIKQLRIEFASLSMLSLDEKEFNFVCNEIRFIPQFYWEWLKSFNFDFNKLMYIQMEINILELVILINFIK